MHVSVKTNYPFSFKLEYNITSSVPVSFYVRIPTWATAASTITRTGQSPSQKLSPSTAGLQKISIPAGNSSTPSTSFTINLGAQPRVVNLANNAVAVYYGALLYSLAIEYNSTATAPREYHDESILGNSTINSHTHDHTIVPTSQWSIAIDPSQIKVHYSSSADDKPLASPIWDLGAPPVELRLRLQRSTGR